MSVRDHLRTRHKITSIGKQTNKPIDVEENYQVAALL
jgi:hypothetical protein